MDKYRNIPNWLIVFTVIFMWPVGLVLIILKYSSKQDANLEKAFNGINNRVEIKQKNDKLDKLKKKRKKYKTFTIIQCIIAVMFFVALFSDIIDGDDIEGGLIVNVIAFGILVPCCVTYFKTDSKIKKIETYQNLILIRDMYNTKKLAEYLGCSRAEVLDFVTYMIREGYLNLDIENDNLVKPKEYVDPAQIFSIICDNCGANNKYVKGKNNKCEYCGSILNLNKI